MGFEKYKGSTTKKGPRSPLSEMKVDEIVYLPESYSRKLQMRIYMLQRRTGWTLEWQECINGGIVIRRAT